MTRFVCVSDTHNFIPDNIPDGDIFIHAGDLLLNRDDGIDLFDKAMEWIHNLPHKHKIIIPGNHDFYLLNNKVDTGDVHLLNETSITLEGYKFYGSPYTPMFYDWAFMYTPGSDNWSAIPDDTNVLITHGPAYGYLDYVPSSGEHSGCVALKERIKELPDIFAHVCGHIHEGYGVDPRSIYDGADILRINASYCGIPYIRKNLPITFEL